MSAYGGRGRRVERGPRSAAEKAYRRGDFPAWEAKWHALSVASRSAFLEQFEAPDGRPGGGGRRPSVPADAFPPEVLEELAGAGFVSIEPGRSRTVPERVVARDEVDDFAARLRDLRRFRLLDPDGPGEFGAYVVGTFNGGSLTSLLLNVLRTAGIKEYPYIEEALPRYVTNRRWPEWVARTLKTPLAGRIVEAIREADGPVPLADLPRRLGGRRADPGDVRGAAEALIVHLALVEDLHPETHELLVGFLPAVRESMRIAAGPRTRPPLVVVADPAELGPDGGLVVDDLRAFLLEVAGEPPRLRQDHGLFQKEVERFAAALVPLRPWLLQALQWGDEDRLAEALAFAHALKLAKEASEDKALRLHLTPEGRRWLAAGLADQLTAVYGLLNRSPSRRDRYDDDELDPFDGYVAADRRFLGEPVQALVREAGKRPRDWYDARPEDAEALRGALDRALRALEPGVFYRLDSVAPHLAFAEHNPLHLGRAAEEVAVYWGGRPVPPLEELREEAGRVLIETFFRERLIPLGCVRAAIDAAGRLAVARHARLDAYFGRAVDPADLAPAAISDTKVIVQPDFSVVAIGLDPAPLAELAPFCERSTPGAAAGATVLKLTRASVVRAVSQGIAPDEILDRLRRHASQEVPANVLREVREWSLWVRQVAAETLTVLRCPDRDAADRVVGALKRQAERLNDTTVAVNVKRLSAAERAKLRDHGILVQDHHAEGPKARPKSSRRR